MKFTYTATNKENKTLQGAMEAADKQTVVANLHKQGLIPVLVKLETDNSNKSKRRKKIKIKERATS
jgi:type II secretory pathway component PulF